MSRTIIEYKEGKYFMNGEDMTKQKVIIQVFRGVVEVILKPKNIDVEIRNFDEEESKLMKKMKKANKHLIQEK